MPRQLDDDLLQTRHHIRLWLLHYQRRYRWSRTELAHALGLSKTTISNVLNEKEWPGLDMMIRLHLKLGAPLDKVIRSGKPDEDMSLPASQTIAKK